MRRLPESTVSDQSCAVRRQRVTVATLPATKVGELVHGYQAGASVNELATRFGIHRATVAQHLHRNGVAIRRRGLDNHQIDHAVRLYQQGLSLVRVGARLEVHAETVRQALRTRGVPMRAAWERGG